jgi:hypothetical protein
MRHIYKHRNTNIYRVDFFLEKATVKSSWMRWLTPIILAEDCDSRPTQKKFLRSSTQPIIVGHGGTCPSFQLHR